jgi:hypothetical protein
MQAPSPLYDGGAGHGGSSINLLAGAAGTQGDHSVVNRASTSEAGVLQSEAAAVGAPSLVGVSVLVAAAADGEAPAPADVRTAPQPKQRRAQHNRTQSSLPQLGGSTVALGAVQSDQIRAVATVPPGSAAAAPALCSYAPVVALPMSLLDLIPPPDSTLLSEVVPALPPLQEEGSPDGAEVRDLGSVWVHAAIEAGVPVYLVTPEVEITLTVAPVDGFLSVNSRMWDSDALSATPLTSRHPTGQLDLNASARGQRGASDDTASSLAAASAAPKEPAAGGAASHPMPLDAAVLPDDYYRSGSDDSDIDYGGVGCEQRGRVPSGDADGRGSQAGFVPSSGARAAAVPQLGRSGLAVHSSSDDLSSTQPHGTPVLSASGGTALTAASSAAVRRSMGSKGAAAAVGGGGDSGDHRREARTIASHTASRSSQQAPQQHAPRRSIGRAVPSRVSTLHRGPEAHTAAAALPLPTSPLGRHESASVVSLSPRTTRSSGRQAGESGRGVGDSGGRASGASGGGLDRASPRGSLGGDQSQGGVSVSETTSTATSYSRRHQHLKRRALPVSTPGLAAAAPAGNARDSPPAAKTPQSEAARRSSLTSSSAVNPPSQAHRSTRRVPPPVL